MKQHFNWLTSSHYKIERFGIMFASVALCMIILMGSIVRHKMIVDANTLGDLVQYTTSTTTSLSGNKVDIQGVYLNSDQTEVFVLAKFNDPSIMITDASKYSLYIAGADIYGNYEELKSSPVGSIYVLGSSGYFGFYLTDVNGFPTQVMSVIVRCDETLYTMDEIPVYEDTSFNDYDQFEVFFNPGAADFEPSVFLDEDRMSVFDIYEGTVIFGEEDLIKEKLEAQLVKLRDSLSKIHTYEQNLNEAVLSEEGVHLTVPLAPAYIRGDEIVEDEDGNLSLKTSSVLNGSPGLTEDIWRNSSLQDDGYVNQVISVNETRLSWYSSLYDAGEELPDKLDTKGIRWVWSDGEYYPGKYGSIDTPTLDNIEKNKSLLETEWSNYYNLKREYMVDLQLELVKLEIDAYDITSTNSTNSSDDAVSIWY